VTDESVFAAAIAIADPVARGRFLESACAGSPTLRQDVEELLAAHAASNPLDRPPANLAFTGAYSPPNDEVTSTTSVGDHIGPYKLLERIGEGGMGEVWVADQLEPIKRRVALKLIKPGMDSRSVLGRFEAERQALAVMDHPNIAKVLDAGTTPDGRPYFVMELVKGTPITEFSDARRLTPKQRLDLFIPVCLAIQHAHMKGIIHRDIKPGNVLVALHDETPVPKVIDFGVAKAVGQQLTEKTIYTGFGALVGTPAYMAPEQATFNQLDIDTRADVYALGVLLYELLAGSPPIEKERLKLAALDEILRIVRDEEPPRPSQRLSTSQAKASIAATRGSEPAKLSQLMQGELDWIVMKALEKDRSRRYDTANGLAADVRRYLAGDAVEACPPTLRYRLRKAYRRNRAAVLTSSMVAVVLLTATALSAALAVWAKRAEGESKQRRIQADASATQAMESDEKARGDRDQARRLLYASRANQADSAVRDVRTRRLNELLEEMKPAAGEEDLRGWEWHYYSRLTRQAETTAPCPCPDTEDGWRYHDNSPAVFSHDGGRVLAAHYVRVKETNESYRLRYDVRDTRTGKSLWSRETWTEQWSTLFRYKLAALSPDGKLIAFLDPVFAEVNPVLFGLGKWRLPKSFRVKVISVDDGRDMAVAPFRVGTSNGIWFAEDGKQVIVGVNFRTMFDVKPDPATPAGPHFTRWEHKSGKVTRHAFPESKEEHPTPDAVTSDGKTAILRTAPQIGSAAEFGIEGWDLEGETPKRLWRIVTGMNPPQISPNGKWLLVTSGKATRVVDSRTGTGLDGVKVNSQAPFSDFALPEDCQFMLDTPSIAYPRAVSNFGRVVLAGYTGTLYVSELNVLRRGQAVWKFQPLLGHTSTIANLFVSGDGTRAVSLGQYDGTLRTWDLTRPAGQPVSWRTPRTDSGFVHPESGPRVISGVEPFSMRGEAGVPPVRVSRPATGDIVRVDPPVWYPSGAQLTPDGRRLLLTGDSPAEPVWSLWDLDATKEPIAGGTSGHFGNAELVGPWLVVPEDAKPWSVRRPVDGKPVCTINIPPGLARAELLQANASGDRLLLVTEPKRADSETSLHPRIGPPDPATIRVFDPNSGRQLWERSGVEQPNRRVGARGKYMLWTADGKRIVVATKTSETKLLVQFLNGTTGTVERALESEVPAAAAVSELHVDPSDRVAVAVGREVHVWRDPERPVLRMAGLDRSQIEMTFSPDGRRLFLLDMGRDGLPGTVTVRDLSTGQTLITLAAPPGVGVGSIFRRLSQPMIWFEGEKLRLLHADGFHEFDGTPLPETKK
jgi:serine/threonine protein kinase/WD40 repeat protein